MGCSEASSGVLEGTHDPGPDAQAWDPGPCCSTVRGGGGRSLQATPPLTSPWHPYQEAGAVGPGAPRPNHTEGRPRQGHFS